ESAKAGIRGRLLLGMESNMDLTEWLSEISLTVPDDCPVPDPFREIANVTPEDVRRVAATYLAPERRYQAIHRPGITPSRLRQPAMVGLGFALASLGVWWLRRNRSQ
ncbi:MAG: insulinase family protein, partial [Acidobacteria bacterium]|nr:insulinase family protein [Acidobacteriota bacterium]